MVSKRKRSSAWRSMGLFLVGSLAACQTAAPGAIVARPTWVGCSELAEDEQVDGVLREALARFFATLQRGEWDRETTVAAHRERYAFFFRSLQRGARDADPVVLKSYSLPSGAFMLSVAFVQADSEELRLTRLVELEAVPACDSFRFDCPYERNTQRLRSKRIGDVTFRFFGELDQERAEEFVAFRTSFLKQIEVAPGPLRYDRFGSLDEMLKAFGLVYDASKCNFLRHDLGNLWADGRFYSTGTGNSDYRFGYVRGALAASIESAEDLYVPYVNGVAAYYGGYGLSGDTMEDLAAQFRAEWQRRPDIQFLEEFDLGRKASIARHFCHYVMCAFLFEEVAAHHGEAVALRLAASGAQGERFFAELERLVGVRRDNLDATIKRLIAPKEPQRTNQKGTGRAGSGRQGAIQNLEDLRNSRGDGFGRSRQQPSSHGSRPRCPKSATKMQRAAIHPSLQERNLDRVGEVRCGTGGIVTDPGLEVPRLPGHHGGWPKGGWGVQ